MREKRLDRKEKSRKGMREEEEDKKEGQVKEEARQIFLRWVKPIFCFACHWLQAESSCCCFFFGGGGGACCQQISQTQSKLSKRKQLSLTIVAGTFVEICWILSMFDFLRVLHGFAIAIRRDKVCF